MSSTHFHKLLDAEWLLGLLIGASGHRHWETSSRALRLKKADIDTQIDVEAGKAS
jgi:hypothetical protein